MQLAFGIFVLVWPIVFGLIYAVLCRVKKWLHTRKYFLIASGLIFLVISIPLLILAFHILSTNPDFSNSGLLGRSLVKRRIISWYMPIFMFITLGILPIYFGVKGILEERKKRSKAANNVKS